MTSMPVLEAELAILTVVEDILTSLPNQSKGVQALEKVIEKDITKIVNELASCYVRGTKIATIAGAAAVEDLKVGDLVVTASGKIRPIVWIGYRAFDLKKHTHPQPFQIYPVLVRANAFGTNQPICDLWLSPGHNVFVNGVLIPVQLLINGVSILRQPVDEFEYWHVELETHDIILAEGLAAESYLNTGNRSAFIGGADYIAQHPDFGPKHWGETCAPLVHDGQILSEVRKTLLERAIEEGFAVSEYADLHLFCKGGRIDPISLGDSRFGFLVPEGVQDVVLMSRTFVPAESEPLSSDFRRLGVCVSELQVNGSMIDLKIDENLGDGWHELERWEDGAYRRWTSGSVSFPENMRLIVVQVVSAGRYVIPGVAAIDRLVA